MYLKKIKIVYNDGNIGTNACDIPHNTLGFSCDRFFILFENTLKQMKEKPIGKSVSIAMLKKGGDIGL